MTGIWPMAALTVVASIGVWGGLLWAMSGGDRRLVSPFWAALPLSAMVNVAIKSGLIEGVAWLAGISGPLGLEMPLWFLAFALMLAPVTEEAMKAVPVVVRKTREILAEPQGPMHVGMAIGLGFGVGEAIYLAWGISSSGQYAGEAWYTFGGFFAERLVVCLLHASLTAVLLYFAAKGRWILGYGLAVSGHAVANFGALLFQAGVAGMGFTTAWLAVTIVLSAGVFEWLRKRSRADAAHLDHAVEGSSEVLLGGNGERGDESPAEIIYWRREKGD